jgi:hypothetical protein
MRKLKRVSLVVAVVTSAVFIIWIFRSRTIQRGTDARVVADIHDLIEQRLSDLKADDPISRRYGAFKRWERRGSWKSARLWTLISRLDTAGIAHFEGVDADVSVHITNGPKAVNFRLYPPDDWLQEQSDQHGFVVSGRKLYVEYDGGRGQCEIEVWACHPDFDPD